MIDLKNKGLNTNEKIKNEFMTRCESTKSVHYDLGEKQFQNKNLINFLHQEDKYKTQQKS